MNQSLINAVICIIACFTFSTTRADINDIEISGLLVNQTKTRIGQSFYHYFSASWQPPQNTGGYNILISERINPQYGSWIWIKVNNDTIDKKMLNRRTGNIKKIAEESTRRVKQFIIYKYATNELRKEQYDLQGDGL